VLALILQGLELAAELWCALALDPELQLTVKKQVSVKKQVLMLVVELGLGLLAPLAVVRCGLEKGGVAVTGGCNHCADKKRVLAILVAVTCSSLPCGIVALAFLQVFAPYSWASIEPFGKQVLVAAWALIGATRCQSSWWRRVVV
jgi:hypothetical protein